MKKGTVIKVVARFYDILNFNLLEDDFPTEKARKVVEEYRVALQETLEILKGKVAKKPDLSVLKRYSELFALEAAFAKNDANFVDYNQYTVYASAFKNAIKLVNNI